MFDIPARFRKELIKFYNKSWPSKSKKNIQQTNGFAKISWSLCSKILCFSKPILRKTGSDWSQKEIDLGCPAWILHQPVSLMTALSCFNNLICLSFQIILTGSLREDRPVFLPSSFWKNVSFVSDRFITLYHPFPAIASNVFPQEIADYQPYYSSCSWG